MIIGRDNNMTTATSSSPARSSRFAYVEPTQEPTLAKKGATAAGTIRIITKTYRGAQEKRIEGRAITDVLYSYT